MSTGTTFEGSIIVFCTRSSKSFLAVVVLFEIMAAPTTLTTIPYTLQQLENGDSQVSFDVPADAVAAITAHPILCRGSAFVLQADETTSINPDNQKHNDTTTTTLQTTFYSPEPNAVAQELSQRLHRRLAERSQAADAIASFLPT
jgi:hypothetical protein